MKTKVQEPLDDCVKYFRRFKHKCVLAIEFDQSTHQTPAFFTLLNSLKKQYDDINERNEKIKNLEKIEEFEKVVSNFIVKHKYNEKFKNHEHLVIVC